VLEDIGLPAAWEEAGISAKKDAVHTRYIEGAAKDGANVETFVRHPAIAARGIEKDIGTKIREHQGFAHEASTEMGNDESNLREVQRYRMKVERVGVAHIELARKTEFPANADTERAAVYKYGQAVIGR